MRKETDLEAVKSKASRLLYVDAIIDENFPSTITHPYADYPFFFNKENLKMCNILECEENHQLFIKQKKEEILSAKDYTQLFSRVTKKYCSFFFKYTKSHLCMTDFASTLKTLWLKCDYVNVDKNISKTEYVKLFRKCDLEILMDEYEYAYYRAIPETITVYRGINKVTNHPAKALSWTIDKLQAEWYAKRFSSEGQVCETVVKKEDILAYFDYEKEIVVDYRKLGELKMNEII